MTPCYEQVLEMEPLPGSPIGYAPWMSDLFNAWLLVLDINCARIQRRALRRAET
jgi:hypothetical protein